MHVVVINEKGDREVVFFDSSTFNIRDGALVIYEAGGEYVQAGIAAGMWVSFTLGGDADGT